MGDRDLVQQVLADFSTSLLSEAEKALFAFLKKVNYCSYEIRCQDVQAVKQAGWPDEAIYDAITVCALFNFFNRWVDATGVHEMAPEEHEKSGKRLAQRGYVMR